MEKRILILAAMFMISPTLKSQDKLIEIIATSDIHGALFPYDYLSKKDSMPSLASLSTYINRQRNQTDREVLLLDNGDILQGDPVVYYYDFIDTTTKHIAALTLNYLHYDAETVGNHDLEGGPQVYDTYSKEVDFPLLSANIIDTRTNKTYFKPYAVFNKSGKKVVVLGLTTPTVPKWLPTILIPNMKFIDMVQSAKHWVSIINEKEHPDVLIGLFHSGTNYTYNNPHLEEYMNENAVELVARHVEGFDAVIGGHDHQGHNYIITNDFGAKVLIIAPTSRLRDFADITISFDENGHKSVMGKLYLTSTLDIDYAYLRNFQPYLTDIDEYFNEPIGIIDGDMTSTDGIFYDDPMSNLIHDVQLYYSGADISFAAPLSLGSIINKGMLYRRDQFKIYKYDNFLYKIKLSGQEIKDYLEYSYWNWFNQMKSSNDYLLRYKLDENNNISSDYFPQTEAQSYNFDSAEGINYTVDLRKGKGKRINITSFTDGRPFELDKVYTVALTSYRGSGGGDHLTEGAGIPADKLSERIVFSSEYDMKYYLEQWIKANSPLTPDTTRSWHIIPEKWYNERIVKESKLFKAK